MGSHASSILTSLRKIVRHLRLSSRAAESKAGVSTAQLFVLSQLASAPAASIRELAERTMTDPSSVSVVVSKLVDAGLVSRTEMDDKRRAGLAITARGRSVASTAPDSPQASMLEALDAMPAERQRAIARALDDLVVALGAEAIEPRMFFEDEPKKKTKGTKKKAASRGQ